MAVQLPLVPSEFAYTFQLTLTEVEYLFEIRWNARSATWFMSVFDADGTPIAQGLAIVLGSLIGRRVVSDDFPDGAFIATDRSGREEDAAFDDLGVRVILEFFTREELTS